MTLQQFEYIVAVDKHRHFVRAAEACGVTQSTLSSMIQKLEGELDIVIFDRKSHPIKPTTMGEAIIKQAREVLYKASQIKELTLSERQQESGSLHMGVIPTIAPYILPRFIHDLQAGYPNIELKINEYQTSIIIDKLRRAELDVALLATPLGHDDLLEIPIYYEKFIAYISPGEPIYSRESLTSQELPSKSMWVLHEGHCLRDQSLEICNQASLYTTTYQAGSIDTLVKIVDANGGYTIIPELHRALLTDQQQQRIRAIVAPEPNREVSLIVRTDFVRERMLNIIASVIRGIIPDHMVDSRLKKYTIKL